MRYYNCQFKSFDESVGFIQVKYENTVGSDSILIIHMDETNAVARSFNEYVPTTRG